MIVSNSESDLNRQVDEKLFRLFVASVKDYAIILIDVNGYILSWNKGAEHINGYSEEEVTGKHISMFYTPEEQHSNELQKNLNAALKTGTHETQGWRMRKDGSAFWANVVFNTIYDDDGELAGYAEVIRDVTEKKIIEDQKASIQAQLENRLKLNTVKIMANEFRFRKLIENSYDGITLFNKKFHVIYRSMAAERINGWSNVESTVNIIMDLVHPDDECAMKEVFMEVLEKPFIPTIIIFREKHKLGHYIWVEGIFTNMLSDPNINAIVYNFRDITERKNAEMEREKITADLLQRNIDLEQFTYIVSHNLRAPVANILGLSNLMYNAGKGNKENEEVLDALCKSANNLDTVIMDLNHVLQAKTDFNHKFETVSLPFLVEDIRSGISYMILKNNVRLTCKFKDEAKLFTIKSYLHSILQNLIVNSIKYKKSDVDPVINISNEVVDDKILISVKDNGKGIDLQKHGSHLFGLYKRFDYSVEGKGMGLFMVKTQVEKLGGTIEVKSEPNVGTEIIIELPLNTSV